MSTFLSRTQMCDQGGAGQLLRDGGGAVYDPDCGSAAVVRYRPKACPDAPWGYRCHAHAGWLDPKFVVVEPLDGEA